MKIRTFSIASLRAPVLAVTLIVLAPDLGAFAQEEEEDQYYDLPAGEPQFFIDSYWIEKRINEEGSAKAVPFTFHPPRFRPDPVLVADEPWEASGIGHFSVLHDPIEEKYRLYYEVENPRFGDAGYPSSRFLIAYAESGDGLRWNKPTLDRILWGDRKETNLILAGEQEARFPHVHVRPEKKEEGPHNLGSLPNKAFRSGRFLMTYRDDRQRLAVSEDGIRWVTEPEGMLRYRTDSSLTLSYNSVTKTYVSFISASVVHESPSPVGRKGFEKWVARLSNPVLQDFWDRRIDPTRLVGKSDTGRIDSIKAFRHGGLFWGFAERAPAEGKGPEVELATSREGNQWKIPKERPTLIAAGETSVWNAREILAADRILEEGENWRMYFSVTGAEGTSESRIGLAEFDAERVVSVRADESGMRSYLETRPTLWPGGELLINADARGGLIEARIKLPAGATIPGYSFEEAIPIQSDGNRLSVGWKNRHIRELKNQVIRIEFRFTNAELFGFLAKRE